MVTTETLYVVRRGGYSLPVGTTLTTTEFTAIKNHKHLLRAGYFDVVRQTSKEDGT